jgi:hypothetical protein
VPRRLNCHITKQTKPEFHLRRQLQFAEQFKIAASQTAVAEAAPPGFVLSGKMIRANRKTCA